MSNRRQVRSLKPGAESLETRQLLARTISGIDLDGDTWTLRLVGAGDLRVTQQPATSTGDPVALGQPGLIDTITLTGPDPLQTRLIGTVQKAAGGDGRVMFQNLEEIGGPAGDRQRNLGMYAIDMPHFWLGYTGFGKPPASGPTPSTGDPSNSAGAIDVPDGLVTLRFGGVDTTFTRPGGSPLNQNSQDDQFFVNLGVPYTRGTSIIVDRVITDAQAASGSGTSAIPVTQDSVSFNVGGRLNVFQANEIAGNAALPPGQFANVSANTSGRGGTYVISGSGIPPFITSTQTSGGVTGQIGFFRVGGNATNLSTMVYDTSGANAKVSNFYVGGETNNVLLIAPNGARNVEFGKGMDRVEINTAAIETLQANRGATSSLVVATERIGQFTSGGDVVNTQFYTGYPQLFPNMIQGARGIGTGFTGVAYVAAVAPTLPSRPQSVGAIGNVLIAGDVTNSIFVASVDPYQGSYDSPNALFFPHSVIKAKVEGTISNPDITPFQPGQAFYAKDVRLTRGPVVPPAVPELPFPHPNAPPRGHRIANRLLPNTPPRPIVTTTAAAVPSGPQANTTTRLASGSELADPNATV